MYLKTVVPKRVKGFYHKLKWFTKHYSDITHTSELESDFNKDHHFHGPITYNTDGLKTSCNADFIKEPRFARAYAAASATNPWPGFTLQWRVYVVCWFADLVKRLPGEFVECGVNTGAYASAVIEYVEFNSLGKTFYLFDTYEGLVEDLVSEEEKKAGIDYYLGNHYPNIYEQVLQTFKPFNTKVIKGAVPYTLDEFKHNSVCFLSIDMNCVAPEIAAAEFFWDKIVSGGMILLDDYGFAPHIQQKFAFDKFAEHKGVNILALPTGQGIIFKP